MIACKCGSKAFEFISETITEYHDASIIVEGEIEEGKVSKIQKPVGSFYLDEFHLKCKKCGKIYSTTDFEDDEWDEITELVEPDFTSDLEAFIDLKKDFLKS